MKVGDLVEMRTQNQRDVWGYSALWLVLAVHDEDCQVLVIDNKTEHKMWALNGYFEVVSESR